MPKIVGECAGHVSTRMNSVCREPELAGAIERCVLVVAASASVLAVVAVTGRARTCVGFVNTRTNSVWKGLGLAGATEKRANKGFNSRR